MLVNKVKRECRGLTNNFRLLMINAKAKIGICSNKDENNYYNDLVLI